jgi:hypothetical protein
MSRTLFLAVAALNALTFAAVPTARPTSSASLDSPKVSLRHVNDNEGNVAAEDAERLNVSDPSTRAKVERLKSLRAEAKLLATQLKRQRHKKGTKVTAVFIL